jgi:hypothetical protein
LVQGSPGACVCGDPAFSLRSLDGSGSERFGAVLADSDNLGSGRVVVVHFDYGHRRLSSFRAATAATTQLI